ncbi:MAG TPA: hypothetical protein VMW16_05340 [Sedimentisphaerales bacterium]|nr:hypothetical protein [Sedimentisphaerales bacterium]
MNWNSPCFSAKNGFTTSICHKYMQACEHCRPKAAQEYAISDGSRWKELDTGAAVL